MNVIFEPIRAFSTPRQCSHIEYNGTDSLGCYAHASFWRFSLDTFGYADKSSRRPVCRVHKDEEELSHRALHHSPEKVEES
jgi:hypothetical protein